MIIAGIATEAYRRPLEERDLDALMAFYEEEAAASGFEGGITVTCSDTWSGSVGASVDGDTVMASFDPALPDQDCCEITLTGDVVDSLWVRTLEGDVNRDGFTNTTDAGAVKLRFSQALATTTALRAFVCASEPAGSLGITTFS